MTDTAALPIPSPLLSVVVAAAGAEPFVAPCVSALRTATQRIPAEILIVGGSGGADDVVAGRTDGAEVRRIAASDGTLVPALWQLGLDESRGSVVAFLSAYSVVDRSWAHSMLDGLSAVGVAGAGGAFRLARSASGAVAAVFFLRFSNHMAERWKPGPYAGELAADNAAYRRADLREAEIAPAEGFWEVEVHRRLRARGRGFVAVAGADVTVTGAPAAGRMLRERFRHGRRFGAWRSRTELSRARVLFAAPLVPVVLTARIVRRVWPLHTYRARLFPAAPWLLSFSAAWAAGEALGALLGDPTTASARPVNGGAPAD